MRLLANLLIGMLTVANVLIIGVTVSNLFGGCRPEEAQGDNRSDSYTARGEISMEEMPAPVRAYVDAVNQNQLESLVLAFAEGGVVVDVSRRIEGREAIRAWARNEVLGGKLRILEAELQAPDRVRLLVVFSPGGTGGFRAYYTFTYAKGLITLADLQYA